MKLHDKFLEQERLLSHKQPHTSGAGQGQGNREDLQ